MTKLALIAADFNKTIVNPMIDAVLADAKAKGVTITSVTRLPGCYEVPLIADLVLAQPDCAGLVVIGFIERGETLHGEVMGHVVHGSLMKTSLRHGKPIGLGIIGPGATEAQAELRKVNYARAALSACLAALEASAAIRNSVG
jgi:6,7-dimethyl-8-ribityllumazine synthase